MEWLHAMHPEHMDDGMCYTEHLSSSALTQKGKEMGGSQ